MRFPRVLLVLATLALAPSLAAARPDHHGRAPHRRDPLASWSRHARGVLSASMQMWMSGAGIDNECGTLTDREGQIYIELEHPSKADLAVLRATLKDYELNNMMPFDGARTLLHATVAKSAIQRIASLRSVIKIDDAKCNHLSAA